ncbi:MAG: hypothetical protein LBQ75_02270 [Zoogloeaceae bacterium]|jgi:hypothetical protein|nr:hypothetical protein [Zoogloeaceae bacterium]
MFADLPKLCHVAIAYGIFPVQPCAGDFFHVIFITCAFPDAPQHNITFLRHGAGERLGANKPDQCHIHPVIKS